MKYFCIGYVYSPGIHMLSLLNCFGLKYFKVKELPDPDGPLSKSVRLGVSYNHLANARATNFCEYIENGFGGNEEDKKRVLYH